MQKAISSNVKSAINDICIVRDVLGTQITARLEQLLTKETSEVTLWKALNGGLNKFSDAQVLRVQSGIGELVETCESGNYIQSAKQKKETADGLVSLTTVRHAEFNLHRQLKLFLMEAQKYGWANDHIYGFKLGFRSYGHMNPCKRNKGEFSFLLQKIDPYTIFDKIIWSEKIRKHPDLFGEWKQRARRDDRDLDEKRLRYLFKLRSCCEESGIKTLYLDRKFFTIYEQAKFLFENGFEAPS